jgi:hypothetical protein
MGVRPVADDIAQAPELVHPSPPLHIIQDCLKGGQVAVYIRDDGIAHGTTISIFMSDEKAGGGKE